MDRRPKPYRRQRQWKSVSSISEIGDDRPLFQPNQPTITDAARNLKPLLAYANSILDHDLKFDKNGNLLVSLVQMNSASEVLPNVRSFSSSTLTRPYQEQSSLPAAITSQPPASAVKVQSVGHPYSSVNDVPSLFANDSSSVSYHVMDNPALHQHPVGNIETMDQQSAGNGNNLISVQSTAIESLPTDNLLLDMDTLPPIHSSHIPSYTDFHSGQSTSGTSSVLPALSPTDISQVLSHTDFHSDQSTSGASSVFPPPLPTYSSQVSSYADFHSDQSTNGASSVFPTPLPTYSSQVLSNADIYSDQSTSGASSVFIRTPTTNNEVLVGEFSFALKRYQHAYKEYANNVMNIAVILKITPDPELWDSANVHAWYNFVVANQYEIPLYIETPFIDGPTFIRMTELQLLNVLGSQKVAKVTATHLAAWRSIVFGFPPEMTQIPPTRYDILVKTPHQHTYFNIYKSYFQSRLDYLKSMVHFQDVLQRNSKLTSENWFLVTSAFFGSSLKQFRKALEPITDQPPQHASGAPLTQNRPETDFNKQCTGFLRFLLDLLSNEINSQTIVWVNRNKRIFKIFQSSRLRYLWNQKRMLSDSDNEMYEIIDCCFNNGLLLNLSNPISLTTVMQFSNIIVLELQKECI